MGPSGTGTQDPRDSRHVATPEARRNVQMPRPPERPPGAKAGTSGRLERWLLRKMLQTLGDPPLRVVLWDGREIGPADGSVDHRVLIHDRRTLWNLIFDPMFQFAEAYAAGTLEVDGDLTDLMVLINRACARGGERGFFSKGLSHWFRRPRRNSLTGSQKNIHHHYDIGNEFYRLWLDERLVYTCAYFPEASFSLEQAQVAKMDHVCRKVRLQPGQRVIEAGCGWGALARHMARHYGVRVTAYNVSHEQVQYARQQAEREGLADRVDFVEDDWRNARGECDAFVSVGMLEHVGLDNYRELGHVIHRTLKPGGLGLIHSIGLNKLRRLNPWIERRIFPGAQPPGLRQMMDLFEPNEFSVLDVENLRLHYAETLRHWLLRFEQSVETVRRMFDERFVRTWRFYLACSAAAFEAGRMQLFQVAFARGESNAVPRNRAYLYADHDLQPRGWQPANG